MRIAYWDRDLRCKFVNRAYCDWYGRQPYEVLGHRHQEIFKLGQVDARVQRLRDGLNGKTLAFEEDTESASGQVGRFQIHITPDRGTTGIDGVLVMSIEVTAERLAQAALQTMNIELTAARDRAEEGARSKSAFLANMSHEIRTPMNAIIGMTHIMQRDCREPKTMVRLGHVSDAAQHLLHVIDDVLDISKVEAGKLNVDSSPFALPGMLERCVSLVREQASAKGLTVVCHGQDLPGCVVGDSAKLSQALVNLLANAVKFSERGKVVLTATAKTDEAGLELRFAVSDNGIGIDADRLPQLFVAFEQADSTTTRRFGGTGLGLALTRSLARAMAGDAGAISAVGHGSTFWITVRVQHGGQTSEIAAVDPTTSTAEASLHLQHAGARVLVAEDNPVNQAVAVTLLEGVGLVVDVAEDGQAAVEMARYGNYDLVLMDMQMPRLDGLEATRAIRRIPDLARLPIVAMTANAFTEDRLAALEAGMNDHMSKPVMPSMLYDTVARWLDKKALRSRVL